VSAIQTSFPTPVKPSPLKYRWLVKEKTDYNNIPFVNLAAGISTDNSGDHFMDASTAMLAFSYALPMSDNNTYLAIGFQGNYTFNRVGNDLSNQFPPQFDKQGALHWAMTIDPYQSGYNYGYLTAGVGAALFHSEEQKQWYIGGTVRHFNHPYTEWTHSVRLPSAYSIQAGYTTSLSDVNDITGYASFTWQPGNNESVIGARYTRYLNDSTNTAASVGISYRAGDALIPDAAFQFGASRLALCYEFNIISNYYRKAYEFSYRLNF